jgi:protein-L-isoaspartate(D-aspartate) O-methyltransferase
MSHLKVLPAGEARFTEQRDCMIEEQLRARGIADSRVLNAMCQVPREEFVPTDLRPDAYADRPLPIGYDQTISQPYTVAFMCEALQLRGNERVLEIGTGSGYAAAVLSLLAKQIFTIERIPELAEAAATRLTRLGYCNVKVIAGDGSLGQAAEAPFDAIVATAAAPALPWPFADQLNEGGRIVIPLGGEVFEQRMYRFTKRGGKLIREDLGPFAFVPLIGKYGWE